MFSTFLHKQFSIFNLKKQRKYDEQNFKFGSYAFHRL